MPDPLRLLTRSALMMAGAALVACSSDEADTGAERPLDTGAGARDADGAADSAAPDASDNDAPSDDDHDASDDATPEDAADDASTEDAAPEDAVPDDAADGGADTIAETTPWLGDASRPALTPTLTAEDIAALLTSALDASTQVTFEGVRDAYLQMMALADDTCPAAIPYDYGDGNAGHYWRKDCVTAGGTHFVGGATFRSKTGVPNGDGNPTDGFTIDANGGLDITAPDGRRLVIAAYVEQNWTTAATWIDSGLYSSGRYHAEGGLEGDDPWLGGELVGNFSRYVGENPEGTYQYVSVNTALSHPAPGVTGLLLGETKSATGDDCPTEPRGAISVRDEGGLWYDVVFDGNRVLEDDPAPDPALCDGCGALWIGGERSGDVCLPAGAAAAFRDWSAP